MVASAGRPEEVPAVAANVSKYCDLAVGLNTWLGDKLDSG